MFFYEGYLCPVCKQKFQESEDIVACPDCGAPHHRECWKLEGRCRFTEDHGTSRQWKRPEEPSSSQQHTNPTTHNSNYSKQVHTCSRCGKENPEFAEFCSRCGMTMQAPDWSSAPGQNRQNPPHYGGPTNNRGYGEYTPFHVPIMDPFGGVAHDEKIEEIPAEDLVTYVGPNSAYYLPRFYKMSRNSTHVSWNWVAFFFTPYWLLYRKNYLAGGILLFLSLLSTMINSYVYNTFILPHLDMTTDAAMFQSFSALMGSGQFSIFFQIVGLLFFINLLVQIIFGLIGNSLYKRTAIKRIRNISKKMRMERVYCDPTQDNSTVAEYRRELSAQGGVSLVLVAVASGIVWFGQMLYQALLLYK